MLFACVHHDDINFTHRFPCRDMHSGELAEVGAALCDNRGRPAVRSIKEADVDGNAKCGGFLHIKSVRIPAAYRAGDTSNVVARVYIVRGALTVPELKGKWVIFALTCQGKKLGEGENFQGGLEMSPLGKWGETAKLQQIHWNRPRRRDTQ